MYRTTDKKDPESLAQGPVFWLRDCSLHTAWPLWPQLVKPCFVFSCFLPPHSFQQRNKGKRYLQLARAVLDPLQWHRSSGPTAIKEGWQSQAQQTGEELLKSDQVNLINLVKLITMAKNSLWRNDQTDLGQSESTRPDTCLVVWGWVWDKWLEESWSGTKPSICVKWRQGSTFGFTNRLRLCLQGCIQTSMSWLNAFYSLAYRALSRSLESFEMGLLSHETGSRT